MTRIPTLFALSALSALTACGGSEDDSSPAGGSMVQVDPPGFYTNVGGDDTGVATPECSGADLCARSIDECGIVMEQDSCEAWYDVAEETGGCRDIDAYEACNCDCIGEDTCDGYFACGQLCFLDLCEG